MPNKRTIWKFPLKLDVQPQRLAMPVDAIIRACGIDPATGRPAIWAECVVPDLPKSFGKEVHKAPDLRPREFEVHATGDMIIAGRTYHGTVFDRQFVWHIFEREI